MAQDSNSNTVRIEGTDLDSVMLTDWSKAMPKSSKVTFLFNLDLAGNRVYLYKMLQSQVKEQTKTMSDKLEKLVGKIVCISGNFKI